MLDLKDPVLFANGDLLVRDDGELIEILAADEKLFEVRGRDRTHLVELAWHLGNRHLAAQIEEDRIVILRDHEPRADGARRRQQDEGNAGATRDRLPENEDPGAEDRWDQELECRLAGRFDGLHFRQLGDASPGKQPAGEQQQEEGPRRRTIVAGKSRKQHPGGAMRVVRLKRRTPRRCSRRAIVLPTAERVRWSRSAAAEKPPASTASTKIEIPFSCSICFLFGTILVN